MTGTCSTKYQFVREKRKRNYLINDYESLPLTEWLDHGSKDIFVIRLWEEGGDSRACITCWQSRRIGGTSTNMMCSSFL